METVVYNNEIVEQHPIAHCCLSTLRDISLKDYSKFLFDEHIKALDVDLYEITSSKGQNDRTVDAAVGICDYKANKATNGRLLLIEFRTNYKNPKNLSRLEICRKVRYSIGILQCGIKIEKQRFLVFTKKHKERAINEVNKMKQAGGEPVNWNVISLEDLATMLHNIGDMPYQPISQLTLVFKSIWRLVEKKDWEAILDTFLKWDEIATDYRVRKYNTAEYYYIVQQFKNFFSEILRKVDDDSFDDYRDLIQEDIKWLCT